jgi:hypothetical protein
MYYIDLSSNLNNYMLEFSPFLKKKVNMYCNCNWKRTWIIYSIFS